MNQKNKKSAFTAIQKLLLNMVFQKVNNDINVVVVANNLQKKVPLI
jgi:hypothetical protein